MLQLFEVSLQRLYLVLLFIRAIFPFFYQKQKVMGVGLPVLFVPKLPLIFFFFFFEKNFRLISFMLLSGLSSSIINFFTFPEKTLKTSSCYVQNSLTETLECCFLKINIANNKHCKIVHNNLKIELKQRHGHWVRESLFYKRKNIPWP